MGYNTTVVIYNDALDQISNDPLFGKKLRRAIGDKVVTDHSVSFSAGNSDAGIVVESHHADHRQVVLTGYNDGVNLGSFWSNGDGPLEVQVARELAKKHGYHLRKNPTKES